jgi:hypothetical protein
MKASNGATLREKTTERFQKTQHGLAVTIDVNSNRAEPLPGAAGADIAVRYPSNACTTTQSLRGFTGLPDAHSGLNERGMGPLRWIWVSWSQSANNRNSQRLIVDTMREA